MKIIKQSAELVSITSNPLQIIEKCGRICYKSEDKMHCDCEDGRCPECRKRTEKFVHEIVRRGHESVLEHASATFLLITDRGISHEIVRHRLASYAQESTRYCNYGNKGGEISVIEPLDLPTKEAWSQWSYACSSAERAYVNMLKEGCSPQWARSVLPTCLKTELEVTANLRQWRHMISLRLCDKAGKAHPQIRDLFGMVLDKFIRTEVAMLFDEFLLDPNIEIDYEQKTK